RTGLLVDAPHCLLERRERRREVGVLTVEILLALRLLLELVDGGEIDLSELLDLGTRLGERLLPGRHVGARLEPGEHLAEVAAGLRELLGERRPPHVSLLGGEACRIELVPRGAHPLLGRQAPLIERPLERRDSTLTCRSRALVCASCERARAEPSAARRSSRSSLSVRSRAASSAASACARASSAAARDRASSAAALSRAMSAALC